MQARADLLLADAAASKVASLAAFKDVAAADRVAVAVAASRTDQQRRFRMASVILSISHASSPSAGPAVATVPVGISAAKGKDAVASVPAASVDAQNSGLSLLSAVAAPVPVSSSPGHPAYTPALRWWESRPVGSIDLAAPQKGGISSVDELASVCLEDVSSEDGVSGLQSSLALLGPTGSLPGSKPIIDDCSALGIVVPGCPLAIMRWKARVISALCRALKRGVNLAAPWVVESAATRLWNRHIHVFSANEYSLAVMPLLMLAAAEALVCLAAVGSTASELCTKFGAVVARGHEESA